MLSQICTAIIILSVTLGASACAEKVVGGASPIMPASSQIVLQTPQGKRVAATYKINQDPKAIILLFHQAGADRREYDDIAPRLVQSGYSVLIVDQGGGGLFDRMIDGKPDMLAAVDWAQNENLPVVIWGSSYSASLVYVLSAEQPEKIKAALAFSGGDYLGRNVVLPAARRVTIPIFATSSVSETTEMKAIFDLVPSQNKQFFLPLAGATHGSGTLTARVNPASGEATWVAVLAFIDHALTK